MMKNPAMQNIVEVLQSSQLTMIVEQANRLNMLNDKVKNCLPSAYRNLFRITNLINDSLFFDVQNATVWQGLLLQQTELLALIQTEFPQVSQLKFKINPNFRPI